MGVPWMAISRFDFLKTQRPLVDVTVTTLKPGQQHVTTANGAQSINGGSVSQTTQLGATLSFASSQTTQSGGVPSIAGQQLSGEWADATDLVIISPVQSGGGLPDVEISPIVDGQLIDTKICITGGVNDNMMPDPDATVGMQHVSLGIPYRQALAARISNLPLKATGLKYARTLQFQVKSTIGWGYTAAPQNPLRILAYGDKMNSASLSELNALLQSLLTAHANAAQNGVSAYDPFAYKDQVPGFTGISGQHVPSGAAITPETWTSLMGGIGQVGTAVWRFLRQAYNAIATTASGVFIMGENVGGAVGNVVGNRNDLTWDREQSPVYTRLDMLGFRAGSNQAYAGVKVNDFVLPTDTGLAVTSGYNPAAMGNAQGLHGSGSGLYFAMRRALIPVVAYRNKVAYFVTANGTAAIPAQFDGTTLQDAAQIGVGGVEITPAA